jgi:L-lysine 6-transaminase
MVEPTDLLSRLSRHLLIDGYDFVLDLDRSTGSRLVDARDGRTYLDMFSFFASNALGMNHPAVTDASVQRRLARAATHKPSNSDVYTVEQGEFVETFERVLGDARLPYLFLIEGGALAVENALKAAFDWKSRHNEAAGRDPERGTKVAHLRHAFHGRTGYTMSLTNTDPVKVARFPKFDWPRIDSPAQRFPLAEHEAANRAEDEAGLAQLEDAFITHEHDVAALIVEPIQAEGGDRHLSERFLQGAQALCRANDVLFVVDEVQTGVGMTGTPWCYQQLGIEPDLVAFGKKTHVCGVMAGGRIDDVEWHVFQSPSRINSTFGGSLTDMVRATVMLEVIEAEGLIDRAATLGDKLQAQLTEVAARHDVATNARGRGLMCALDLPDTDTRDRVTMRLFRDERVFLLGCGETSIRFRPTLTVSEGEIDDAVDALDRVLTDL